VKVGCSTCISWWVCFRRRGRASSWSHMKSTACSRRIQLRIQQLDIYSPLHLRHDENGFYFVPESDVFHIWQWQCLCAFWRTISLWHYGASNPTFELPAKVKR
jgi:hypothetical protein